MSPEQHEKENPTHKVIRKLSTTYCENCDYYVSNIVKIPVRRNEDGYFSSIY